MKNEVPFAVENVDVKRKQDTSSTFIDNMSLPIHRWYRYSAGFSAQWVEKIIISRLNCKSNNELTVLDPFAGAGTTLLASEKVGVKAYGFESHPFVSIISKSKLLWRTDIKLFKEFGEKTLQKARLIQGTSKNYPKLIYQCYTDDAIKKLDSIKKSLEELNDNSAQYYLTWLAFVAILRNASHAGTAQWQYILPNKTKVNVSEPRDAFIRQIELMINDMFIMQEYSNSPCASLYQHDVRKDFESLNNSIDLIITSPPYANNYDYADATRLELSFLGYINSWGDLQDAIRKHLIRSCTQQVSKERKRTFDFLQDNDLKPIYEEIYEVCRKLEEEKEFHGGKKNYYTMIALYFLDLAKTWVNLRKICKNGSEVCLVIGDSAPYGIYVPVDKWLGELAIAAGFKEYTFEKTRDRNIKWKNRKHTVPLKEGQLWVKG